MLTKEQVEKLTIFDLACSMPAMKLKRTALELYAKLEKAEDKIKQLMEKKPC